MLLLEGILSAIQTEDERYAVSLTLRQDFGRVHINTVHETLICSTNDAYASIKANYNS